MATLNQARVRANIFHLTVLRDVRDGTRATYDGVPADVAYRRARQTVAKWGAVKDGALTEFGTTLLAELESRGVHGQVSDPRQEPPVSKPYVEPTGWRCRICGWTWEVQEKHQRFKIIKYGAKKDDYELVDCASNRWEGVTDDA